MAKIEFVNLREVQDGLKKRQDKLKNIPKVARQMGVLATNEIHPLTAKKTGNWDSTIHAEVSQISSFKWELWVGSKGAFSANGYNYGALQERTRHPIEIGWYKAKPAMTDLWQKMMHGAISRNVSMGSSDSRGFGESMATEFAIMGGF